MGSRRRSAFVHDPAGAGRHRGRHDVPATIGKGEGGSGPGDAGVLGGRELGGAGPGFVGVLGIGKGHLFRAMIKLLEDLKDFDLR